MKQSVVLSQYLQIALDLATRIAKGELPEGCRSITFTVEEVGK